MKGGTVGPVSVRFDVTQAVPLDGSHHVSAWVFTPEDPASRAPLLFCLPGGSYGKAYWHLEVPGRSGYSFAEHMAARGMTVVAVDHLGSGDSSRHSRAAEVTPEVVAAANAAVVDEVVQRARAGTLAPGVGAVSAGPLVGVGHSMGAMLTICQQSLHGSFDAVAPLGYGVTGPITKETVAGSPLPTVSDIMRAAREGAFDGGPLLDRTRVRDHFYWEDVPDDVIAADDRNLTCSPGVCGQLSIVPFIVSAHARRLQCPVFIGLGERDSVLSHYDEPRGYAASPDLTLFVLATSAHCHNVASTRAVLWDRLARWIGSLETA